MPVYFLIGHKRSALQRHCTLLLVSSWGVGNLLVGMPLMFSLVMVYSLCDCLIVDVVSPHILTYYDIVFKWSCWLSLSLGSILVFHW